MGEVLCELQAMKVKDSNMKKKLSDMQIELSKIRQLSKPLTIFSDTGRSQLGGLASLGVTNHFANLSLPPTTSDNFFLRASRNESVKFTETLKAKEPFKNEKKEKPR